MSKYISNKTKNVNSSQSKAMNLTNYFIPYFMCILGAIFYCYEYFLRVAPSVLAGELKIAFNCSDAALGHLSACFYYTYVLMLIPVGMLIDRYGPRLMISFACLCCVIGTFLFGGTENFWLSQLGRLLVGFGSAFAFIGSLKIANLWLPMRHFATVAGLTSALGMLGAISGEALMVELMKLFGWRESVMYSGYAGILLTVILLACLRDSGPRAQIANKTRETFSTIKKGLVEIIKIKQLWINGVIGALTFLPITLVAELWGVEFIRSIGYSKHTSTIIISMLFVGFAIGAPSWSIISDKLKSRRIPLIIGSAISCIFTVWYLYFPSHSSIIMSIVILISALFASAQILVFAICNDLSRSEVIATAVAFTNALVMTGGALSQPLAGIFIDMVRTENSVMATYEQYAIALSILPIGLFISIILSYILKESFKHH